MSSAVQFISGSPIPMNTMFVAMQRRIEQRELAHLTGDLVRLEVAREAHQPRRAERALQRAPRLRRDAERQAIAVGNRDGLDVLSVVQAEQKLLGAVGRLLPRRDLEPRNLERSASAARNAFGSSVISSNDATGACHRSARDLAAAIRGLAARDARTRAQRCRRSRRIEIEEVGLHRKMPLSTN